MRLPGKVGLTLAMVVLVTTCAFADITPGKYKITTGNGPGDKTTGQIKISPPGPSGSQDGVCSDGSIVTFSESWLVDNYYTWIKVTCIDGKLYYKRGFVYFPGGGDEGLWSSDDGSETGTIKRL